MIIDLHSHLIPSIDDGAQTIEESIELTRLAVSEGVRHMGLTHHHRNGKYINRKEDVLKAVEELTGIYERNNT